MKVIIRNLSDQPIYRQIAEQIQQQILAGELKPGEALPSVRGLAKDLKISVITTRRAYDQLEAAGYICTAAGRGCFVAEHPAIPDREQLEEELRQHIREAIRISRALGEPDAGLIGYLTWELSDDGRR